MSTRVAFCCLLAVSLGLPGAMLANDQVAVVKNFGDALVFFPEVPFNQLVLTVTGPCNFEDRQVVTRGEPFFRLTPETIDGTYRYQLVVIPNIEPEIIEILQDARKIGDNSQVDQLCREGKLPGDPLTQAGGFIVANAKILYEPDLNEGLVGDDTNKAQDAIDWAGALPASGGAAGQDVTKAAHDPAAKDFVINDDLIVDGSACIGFDCVNGESFGFDTIRLKENNLRIKFDDTSVAASFPRNDWQLTANDSANGGASKFSIDDISGSRTPFTVEANARSHSLYIDDGGRIGSRTSTPSTEIHTIDGDTPTLRLQQDGSSGFAPQTWDVAGNETNFFIRDVTNGSTLPFRIRPSAPTSSIFIDVDGDVGIGTASPSTLSTGEDASIHVLRSDGEASILVEETNGTAADRTLLELENNGLTRMRFNNTNGPAIGDVWDYQVANGGGFQISAEGSGNLEFLLDTGGNLTVSGGLVTGSGGACDPGPCDGTFTDYEVESIEEHAAYMWENSHLWGVGPTPEGEPINITKKTTGILHELEKAHIYIEQLNNRLKAKDDALATVNERLERLEALLAAQAGSQP